MPLFYRIVPEHWAPRAFDGEGARLYGGRWNSPGSAAVYLAESRALAALEIFVHAQHEALRLRWMIVELEIDDSRIDRVPPPKLPPNWRLGSPVPTKPRASAAAGCGTIGTSLCKSQASSSRRTSRYYSTHRIRPCGKSNPAFPSLLALIPGWRDNLQYIESLFEGLSQGAGKQGAGHPGRRLGTGCWSEEAAKPARSSAKDDPELAEGAVMAWLYFKSAQIGCGQKPRTSVAMVSTAMQIRLIQGKTMAGASSAGAAHHRARMTLK